MLTDKPPGNIHILFLSCVLNGLYPPGNGVRILKMAKLIASTPFVSPTLLHARNTRDKETLLCWPALRVVMNYWATAVVNLKSRQPKYEDNVTSTTKSLFPYVGNRAVRLARNLQHSVPPAR
jgi:hypothetical protein